MREISALVLTLILLLAPYSAWATGGIAPGNERTLEYTNFGFKLRQGGTACENQIVGVVSTTICGRPGAWDKFGTESYFCNGNHRWVNPSAGLTNGSCTNANERTAQVSGSVAQNYQTCDGANNKLWNLNTCAQAAKFGQVYCWGSNTGGALGIGSFVPATANTPGTVISSTVISFTQISAGWIGAPGTEPLVCGVDVDGKAYCWGTNDSGALGTGNTTYTSSSTPMRVISTTNISFTQVSAYAASNVGYVCGIDINGKAYCWGDNTSGQLGTGNTTYTSMSMPMRVISTTAISFTQISAGQSAVCGIDINGKTYCWGSNSGGGLGIGNTVLDSSSTPMRVISTTAISFTQISTGGRGACAIDIIGKAYCWGLNVAGQLGTGNTTYTSMSMPMQVISSTAISFTQISMGNSLVCGVDIDGKGYCWGSNTLGALGTGSTSYTSMSTPMRVISTTAISFTQISAGGGMACGVDINGKGYCWGTGTSGQLGGGNNSSSASPTVLVSTTMPSITQISAGTLTSCAVYAP